MKLELTWSGKEAAMDVSQIPLRTLNLNAKKSYGDTPDGVLIHGDNLDALRALLPKYRGQVKSIYIDPPYNINAAVNGAYKDNMPHSDWLSMMAPRLKMLWELLKADGFLAVQIDDGEFARLYMLMAEICGEQNLKTICVKMSESTGVKMASVNKTGSIPKLKEFIILAGKSGIKGLKPVMVRKEKWDDSYGLVITNKTQDELQFIKDVMADESRTEDQIKHANALLADLETAPIAQFFKEHGANLQETEFKYANAWRIIRTVSVVGSARKIADGLAKKTSNNAFLITTKKNSCYLIRNGYDFTVAEPRIKLLFADEYLVINAGDFWVDIKTTGLGNEGGVEFKNSKKPEALIARILHMTTNPGDLVLDSFLGSGTTCAVAHKMGRKWIGIEMGDHFDKCVERMKKVVDGEQGGISKDVKWNGGGGFNVRTLGESVFLEDGELNPNLSDEQIAELVFADAGGAPRDFVADQLPFVGIANGIEVFYTPHATDKPFANLKGKTRRIVYYDTHDLSDETLINKNIATKHIVEALYV